MTFSPGQLVLDGRLEWDGMHSWTPDVEAFTPLPPPGGRGAEQNSPFFLIGMADSVNV